MKPIQIMMDEALLQSLDQDEEVRREGRSAVLRRAVAEYLERRRARQIAAQYQEGYGERPGLGEDWEGWDKEGQTVP